MSAYRDEREALAARIEQLERELADARREIARLRRGGDGELAEPSVFLGAPSRVVLERTLSGELPDEALEQLVEVLRLTFGQMGRREDVGRTAAWRTDAEAGRRAQVFIIRGDGTTRIRVEEKLGSLAGGLFGGVVGGAGAGGVVVILAIAAETGLFLPFGAALSLLWAGLTYSVARTTFAALGKTRERQLFRLIEELEALAREALEEPVVRARVSAEEEDVVDASEAAATRSKGDASR